MTLLGSSTADMLYPHSPLALLRDEWGLLSGEPSGLMTFDTASYLMPSGLIAFDTASYLVFSGLMTFDTLPCKRVKMQSLVVWVAA